MQDFVAIDFETANQHRSSVCSVGIVIVREGEITDKYYSLIKPEPEFYSPINTQIHGISYADTAHAAIFPMIWNKIETMIGDLPLIAHNKSFDESCLKASFRMYQLDYPEYDFLCTLQMAKSKLKGQLPDYKLNTVSRYLGFKLTRHHHALADAEACAWIARYL